MKERINRVLFGSAAVTARDRIGAIATDMIVIAVMVATNQGIGPDLDHRSGIPTGTELIVGEAHPALGAEIGVEAMSERGIKAGIVITPPYMIVEGMGTADEKGTQSIAEGKGTQSTAEKKGTQSTVEKKGTQSTVEEKETQSTTAESDMITLHTLHGGVSNEIECLSISRF